MEQKSVKKPKKAPVRFHLWFKAFGVVSGFVLLVLVLGVSFFVREAHEAVVSYETEETASPTSADLDTEFSVVPFPVSVDPVTQEIVEDPELKSFIVTTIPQSDGTLSIRSSWISRALGRLALMNWYQNLASLSSRVLVIEPGERREQIADHFAKILKWSKEDKEAFLTLITVTPPELDEGKMFPGTYSVARDATPEEVAPLVIERFDTEVLSRYTDEIEATVPLTDALTIASLLEREAYDFDDMRHISGVIWNRLFAEMKLQIDATLQYAKGSEPDEPWWPRVTPSDKYLASEFNTYKNEGLPPAPIANPSLEAIIAALNPVSTDCMFYFHDKKGGFHCTATYEEHVELLKRYYGRGK